jgi:AcrR family transcriptional regulator
MRGNGVPETKEESVKARILRVARNLIAQQGIYKTSLAEISREAGISRGTLFYYFPSKQDLLYQIMEESIQELTEKVVAAIKEIQSNTKTRDIFYLLLRYIGESHALNQTNFHLFQEAMAKNQRLKKRFQESYRQWQSLMGEHICQLFPKTAARYGPQNLAALMLALIDGVGLQSLLEYGSLDYKALARAIAGIFQEDSL